MESESLLASGDLSAVELMKKYLVFAILLTSSCCVTAGGFAFPQTPARSPRSIHKPGRPAAEKDGACAYVVKKGDTLYGIAGSRGMTVAALKSINHLRSSRLKIGQKLKLFAPKTANGDLARTTTAPQARESVAPESPATVTDSSIPVMSSLKEEDAPDAASPDGGADPNLESKEEPLRMRLASAGIEFLGVRYRWTGISELTGFDCSGLVKCLFDKFNISLPRSSREQFKVGEKVDKNRLEVGDLVFFSSRGKTPTHVGVYLGDNKFLHAARRAREVIISNLTAAWYSKRFLGARRLLDLWEPESKPAEPNSP